MNYELIKVCGMREAENIHLVEQLFGLHSSLFTFWMGFIFWPKSSRYVSEPPAYLPQKVKRVGVFVDASVEDICRHINDYKLDVVQLHGNESPELICKLRSLCGDAIAIVKAFNIAAADDFEGTKPYEELVDYFLFDTKGKSVGGNGKKFDWSVLASYAGKTPFLLSGGIGPDDAEHLRALRELDGFPVGKCLGIDLNSRFEIAPGLKDIHQLKTFLEQL